MTALKAQEDARALNKGQAGVAALGGGAAAAWGASCGAGEMSPQRLKVRGRGAGVVRGGVRGCCGEVVRG